MILKNAGLSIIRNKGRNILIGIIIFVIAVLSTITLAIRNSSNSLIDSYYDAYEVEATIGVSREQVRGNMQSKEEMDEMKERFSSLSITEDEIKNYGDSEYVSSYYYTATTYLNSDSLEKVSSEIEGKGMFGGGPNGEQTEANRGDFFLVGYNSYEAMEEFISGDYTITEGEVSSDFSSNKCLVNEELATSNELSVGDSITLISVSDISKTYTLVISGIYSDNSNTGMEDKMNMFSNSANKIITNMNYVLNIDSDATLAPTYKLTSTEVLDAFVKEVEDKGLDEYLEVQDNLDEVENKISSISNLKSFVSMFLIITLLVGGIVLFVINMINIRERKYEIGVLRTIGMSKFKLSLQFISEVMIVALCALVIGLGVGSVSSVPVANYLLKNEIESSKESMENINKNFGREDMKGEVSTSEEGKEPVEDNKDENMNFGTLQVNEVTEINAVVDIKVIVELIGIGLLLTFISSLASMISIQRFSPLTILKERS